jgi:flagella basal body P-ring formation protein FlgA
MALLAGSNGAQAQATLGPEAIAAAAEHALRSQAGADAATLTLQPTPLDARLRLIACDRPLHAAIMGDGEVHARTVVAVSCEGAVRWTIYTSFAVESRITVLVARRALAIGSALAPSDVQSETRKVPGLAVDYVCDPAAIAGQQLARAVAAGAPLPLEALVPAPLVRRGQEVVLLARAGGIEVRVAAVALADGRLAEHIKVENSSSQRVVEGIVRSTNLVEAPL